MEIKSLLVNHLLAHDGNVFHVQVSLISSRLAKEMSDFGVFLVHIWPYLDKKGVLQSTNLRNHPEYGKIQPNKNSEKALFMQCHPGSFSMAPCYPKLVNTSCIGINLYPLFKTHLYSDNANGVLQISIRCGSSLRVACCPGFRNNIPCRNKWLWCFFHLMVDTCCPNLLNILLADL